MGTTSRSEERGVPYNSPFGIIAAWPSGDFGFHRESVSIAIPGEQCQ